MGFGGGVVQILKVDGIAGWLIGAGPAPSFSRSLTCALLCFASGASQSHSSRGKPTCVKCQLDRDEVLEHAVKWRARKIQVVEIYIGIFFSLRNLVLYVYFSNILCLPLFLSVISCYSLRPI
jgi:hypothetical protein